MAFDLGDYNDVASRITEFREKHPEGSLQPADPGQPFRVVEVGDKTFLAYTAAAYRTPDDPRPGIGVAWEPFPGRSNYTRDSELQNAETSAWGRAIVAALAADTRKGIASREEVAFRSSADDAPPPVDPVREVKSRIVVAARANGLDTPEEIRAHYADLHDGEDISAASLDDLSAYLTALKENAA